MNRIVALPVDLNGMPYAPKVARNWLTPKVRADFAEIFDCDPREVEYRLDARDAMTTRIAERREYDDPCGQERSRY
jgi:hypothetical protein